MSSNRPASESRVAPGLPPDGLSPEETVVAYHERTKHHYHRYAASRGSLDWATQPNPFRRFAGAPLVTLPLGASRGSVAYWQLYVPGSIDAAPLGLESLASFFRSALSLTAWKRLGSSAWALRANPSSGNLHPTEGYALLPPLVSVHGSPAVYHYAAGEHALERRAELDVRAWSALTAAFPPRSFLVGLSSVQWREAWKYGERAFRYCQHDIGHALGALGFAAALHGWKLTLLDAFDAVGPLLGLDRGADFGGAEPEEPELLALVTTSPVATPFVAELPRDVDFGSSATRWSGSANALSPEHGIHWEVIDEVAAATRAAVRVSAQDFSRFPSEDGLFPAAVRSSRFGAETVILGRRSAVAMDGSTAMTMTTFYEMLARLVPTADRRQVPWDAVPWRPRVHLGLFVHRVEGLAPGLYALARDPEKLDPLRAALKREFLWQRLEKCPPGLPLYLLEPGDCRALAARVSCAQNIAADGAFSLGMIAEYLDPLSAHGAGVYRQLFWEAGLIGQVLYLEAEAAGLRATGIGCYFDDPVHAAFGITSREWQSLYHFSVGAPIEDTRLTTLPGYTSATR